MSYVATRRGAKLRSKVQGIDPRAVWWEHRFTFMPLTFLTYLPPRIVLQNYHLITPEGKLITYDHFATRTLQLSDNDNFIGMNMHGLLLFKSGTSTLKLWYGIWDEFLILQVPSELQDLNLSFKYNRVYAYNPSQNILLFWEVLPDKTVKQVIYQLPEQYKNVKLLGFANEKAFLFKAQIRPANGQGTKEYKLFQLDYTNGAIFETEIKYTETVNNQTKTYTLDVKSIEGAEDDNGLYLFSKTSSAYLRQDNKIFYLDYALEVNSVRTLKIGPTLEDYHIYLLVYKADESYDVLVKTSDNGSIGTIYSGAIEKFNLQYFSLNTPLIFIYDGTNTHVFIDKGGKIETKQFANTDFGENFLQHSDLKVLADIVTYDSQKHALVFGKKIELNLDDATQVNPSNQIYSDNAQIKLDKIGQISRSEAEVELASSSITITPFGNTFYIVLPKFEIRWWFSTYPIGIHPFLNPDIPSIMYGKKGNVQANLNLVQWYRSPEGVPKKVYGQFYVYIHNPWLRATIIVYNKDQFDYTHAYFAHFMHNFIPSKVRVEYLEWAANTYFSFYTTAFSIDTWDNVNTIINHLVKLGDYFYSLKNTVRELLEMHGDGSKLYVRNLVTNKSFIIHNHSDLIYNFADLSSLNPLWDKIIKDGIYFKPPQSLSVEIPWYNIEEDTTVDINLVPETNYPKTSYVEPTYEVQIPSGKSASDYFVHASIEDADEIRFTEDLHIEVIYYFPSAYKDDTIIIPRAIGPLYVGWELEAQTPGLEFIADYFKWYESFADWFEIVARDKTLAEQIRTFLPELHTTGVPDEYVGSY